MLKQLRKEVAASAWLESARLAVAHQDPVHVLNPGENQGARRWFCEVRKQAPGDPRSSHAEPRRTLKVEGRVGYEEALGRSRFEGFECRTVNSRSRLVRPDRLGGRDGIK